MSFLVDTSVIVYTAAESRYRDACAEILQAIGEGRAEGRISTAILEEVWHLELSGRCGGIDGLTSAVYRLFTPLLPVTDETVVRALALDADALGANDRIHAATALQHGLTAIVTADADFDGVAGLRRVDPLDERARSRLLAG